MEALWSPRSAVRVFRKILYRGRRANLFACIEIIHIRRLGARNPGCRFTASGQGRGRRGAEIVLDIIRNNGNVAGLRPAEIPTIPPVCGAIAISSTYDRVPFFGSLIDSRQMA